MAVVAGEPAATALRVEEITDLTRLSAVAEAWDAVALGAVRPNVFATSDWLAAWWTRFDGGRRLRLLLVSDTDGAAVGALPLMVSVHRGGGVPLRVLELLGVEPPACADHLEVLALPGRETGVAAALAGHLDAAGGWDAMRLAGVPEEAAATDALFAALGTGAARVSVADAVACPFLPLTGPWEPYEAHLQRKFRDLKKYLRAVEQRGGRFLLADTPGEAARLLGELRRLNRLRVEHKGDVPSLGRDDFAEFVADVGDRFVKRGWLRLHALEVEGTVVGVNLNFAHGAKVYGYMSGLDPAWTRHGIGTVMMRQAVRSAAEEGFAEYDFLRGEEEYKARWTSERRSPRVRSLVRRPLAFLAFSVGRLAARAGARLRDRLRGRAAAPLAVAGAER